MVISLENLVPLPLKEVSREEPGFWEKEKTVFESPSSILITAPSGKGKTSLLSMIFGIRKDYLGKISIDGRDTRQYSQMEWSGVRRQKISYIFQGLELFDELTALENILLKNRILDYKTGVEISTMAQALEMEQFLNRETGKLSFGQRQRIAIIRSLCQPFEFLMGDEIFSHLDERLGRMAFDLVSKECSGKNAGLMLTSLHALESYRFDRQIMI